MFPEMDPVSKAVHFNYRCWSQLKELVEEEQEKIKRMKATDGRVLRTQTSLDILSDSELETMVLKRISSPALFEDQVVTGEEIAVEFENKRKPSSAV